MKRVVVQTLVGFFFLIKKLAELFIKLSKIKFETRSIEDSLNQREDAFIRGAAVTSVWYAINQIFIASKFGKNV